MRYTGNKSRIVKHILPIILKHRKQNQWFVEPFVGGANITAKVEGLRLASDTNKYLIEFYHQEFWQWCRDKANQGHTVFISEYNAPSDFECVWSMEVSNTLSKQNSFKRVEKLFKFRGGGA
jgi:hypothetical protein